MLTSRIVAALVAVVLATGGLAAVAPAPADAAAGCTYRVVRIKTRLNVRAEPRGRIVDKLYPGDRTWGSCRKAAGAWRRIHGTEIGRRGFSFGRYLKKIGRR
ncbi:hypothetical protein FXF51_42165 [Nonomuraea sp. PA05]|uniref:hypothetical protein n=1 Tax=Nonomuraea sp. PA05 TaxID=2604466 RepID=UPI0011D7A250|nr:hypothetical protein [Nonomuraea sp. PA05]TYB56727.1 hypothetical protein FXF51_42165 [Nonomuraea sp. PA05]